MTDFNNTPEQLKVMAEALGLSVNPCVENNVITVNVNGHWFDFNPREDANQWLEIVEYLLKDNWNIGKIYDTYQLRQAYTVEAQTLADAVLSAYWESLK